MEYLEKLLGLGLQPSEMNTLQVCLRAFVVFVSALIIVRVANRRFLGKLSALDVILGFVLASMLARAINGSGPLFQSIAAGFVLVFLHRVLAFGAARSHKFGKLVKGEPDVLIENGRLSKDKLRVHNITEADLLEALRVDGSTEDLNLVRKATLERDGTISVVKKNQ
jgi:uncharacterized membrane protein YcaP (DUF421 family)